MRPAGERRPPPFPSALPAAAALLPGVLLGVLLLVFLGATGGGRAASDEPASREGAAKRPEGLLGIAEAEAQKQQALLEKKIRDALTQLGIYTDPSLAFVQQKMREIISLGPAAVPILFEAARNPSGERSKVNSGRMAALILAQIADERIGPGISKLLAEGNDRAKINALVCLGALGKAEHRDEIESLLSSKNPEVRAEALLCMARMKLPRTPDLAKPFLEEKDERLELAGIEALTLLGDAAREGLVLPILSSSQNASVIDAAIRFLDACGTAAAIPVLVKNYETKHLKRRQRIAAIKALKKIGKRAGPKGSEPIIAFLKTCLSSFDSRTIREAAFALNDLGDDTGVKMRTQQLDRLIAKHSSAEYYFRRGEIFLEFKKYKQAQRDFNEGLRKDRKGGRYGSQVFIALARCYAAEGRFADTERTLRKAGLSDTTHLPREYEEFRKMAADERYGKVFRPGWK